MTDMFESYRNLADTMFEIQAEFEKCAALLENCDLQFGFGRKQAEPIKRKLDELKIRHEQHKQQLRTRWASFDKEYVLDLLLDGIEQERQKANVRIRSRTNGARDTARNIGELDGYDKVSELINSILQANALANEQ